MTTVFVDTTEITDWPSLHRVFSRVFGFPPFYGNNLDALIDCLGWLVDQAVLGQASRKTISGRCSQVQQGRPDFGPAGREQS
ncbi:barstar family protein [Burkholderia pyrrocinia]